MDFAQNLIILRKLQGKTQAKIALKFKLTPKSISFWENGEREPQLSTLCALADYFGVTTDQLLGRAPLSFKTKVKVRKVLKARRR